MKWRLFLIPRDSRNPDTQADLSLTIDSEKQPVYLSDFTGGTATFLDGYAAHTTYYDIHPTDYDTRRLLLVPTSNNFSKIEISPEFIRSTVNGDPNHLTVVPLKIGQNLLVGFSHNDINLNYIVKNFYAP